MRWVSIIATVVALGAAGSAVVLADDLPSVGTAEQYAPVPTVVTPDDPLLVCPGPVTLPLGGSGEGDTASTAKSAELEVLPVGVEELDGGASVTVQTAATSVETVIGGDTAGLAAAACTAPVREQWVLGGTTEVGASARLVLANPGETAVQASVEVYGALGLIDTVEQVVAASSNVEMRLEGVELDMASVAVRVTASGTGVAAFLQDTRLQGFTAAGTDWATAGQASTRAVVPVASINGAEATLRLLAPEGATVSLTMRTSTGAVPWDGAQRLELPAGEVVDLVVPRSSLTAVEVDADAPVLASALVQVERDPDISGGDPAHEIAWTYAAAPVAATTGVVVPAGSVALVASAELATTLAVSAGDDVIELEIEPGTVVRTELDVAPGTVLSATTDAAWALLIADENGFVTTVQPRQEGALSTSITTVFNPTAP